MHMLDWLRRAATALVVAGLVLPAAVDAQSRAIVSKSISASSSGSALAVVFEDDTEFSLALEDGRVFVDGAEIGSYPRGGELDDAWRALIQDAMSLENGELAEALDTWEAPTSDEIATRVDEALERAVRSADDVEVRDVRVERDEESLGRFLLRSLGRLDVLEEALDGLDEDVEVYVDEDVRISDRREGTIVVIDGTLRIDGTLDGDAVVVGGVLDLREDGEVLGQVRLADTRVARSEGDVRDGIIDLLEEERESDSDLRAELRDEIRAEFRDSRDRDGRGVSSVFRPVTRTVGNIVEKLIAVFLIGLMGAGFIGFAGQNVDAVSETARRSPGRSAAVGLAGSILLVPVWLLGTVALVISIVGIPVAIAWLPLFPLAAALAGVLGFVAVARNAGEWMADSNLPWTGWIRKSNHIFTLFGGLIGIAGLFIAGHIVSIVPLLGVFGFLFILAGGIAVFAAAQIGFGAVLLTRAGRRREYPGRVDPDAAWAAAMDMDLGGRSAASDTDGKGR